MQLAGKTVLIPGASRPVGRAIARAFGKEGAHLLLPVYDWPESIIEMEEEFSKENFSMDTIQLDLRHGESAEKLSQLAASRGGLDYLINNIERGGMPVVHGSYQLPHNKGQWEREFETTLKAKWLLFEHCFPKIKNGGAVINISSVAGRCGRSGAGAPFFSDGYAAANSAIHSFTQNWARQAAPHVRVNELMLGLIQHRHGEGTRGWGALTEEEKKKTLQAIPLQRTGKPEEVAKMVFFLAVEARYITGTIFTMDGGLSLGKEEVPPLPPGIL